MGSQDFVSECFPVFKTRCWCAGRQVMNSSDLPLLPKPPGLDTPLGFAHVAPLKAEESSKTQQCTHTGSQAVSRQQQQEQPHKLEVGVPAGTDLGSQHAINNKALQGPLPGRSLLNKG